LFVFFTYEKTDYYSGSILRTVHELYKAHFVLININSTESHNICLYTIQKYFSLYI